MVDLIPGSTALVDLLAVGLQPGFAEGLGIPHQQLFSIATTFAENVKSYFLGNLTAIMPPVRSET